jgi:DNA gyrase/topoisomerase IV subunit B/transcriptional regulator with XRE-family HTH domain
MTDKPSAQTYDESNITYLEPMKHIRLRPGMYVGGTDSRALHHLIYEVVDNSIDEALAGRCDTIIVTLHDDNYVSVADNGVGIPVGMHAKEGISTLQLVMTKVGAGGKFDNSAYKVSGGLHGVGVSAVNALSAQLIAQVKRDGYLWQQTYQAGEPMTSVEQIRSLENGEPTGTTIIFQPDFTILEPNEFSYSTLTQRFREMAFVTRRVTITVRDERIKPVARETTFYFEGGLRSFVKYLNRNRETLHEPVYAEREVEYVPELNNKTPYSVGVEFAFQYNDSAAITELAFANTINTPDGGAHLTGMRSAITGVINRYARKAGLLKEKDPNFSGSDTLEGITAIVSVKHPHPSFESQTKVKLINPEVQGLASQVVTEAFNEFLEVNPREARKIVEKCMTSMRAREAARKARELVRSGPSLLESTTLPGKLADCSKHGEGSEIYIVEGDSAGGCFAGDTRVALVDGRNLSFEELVKEQAEGKTHFCYTIRRDGTIGVEQILHARVTKRNAEVIRLTLDNGEQIVCTPDHRFMLHDGSYKAAADLSDEDSLMPLYRKLSDHSEPGITINGYEMVWNPRSNGWLFTHLLADWYNRWKGIYTEEDGDHCHHIDFNKLNNNPTNLKRMPAKEHLALHRNHLKHTLHRPDVVSRGVQLRRSAAFRQKMSARMRQAGTRQILSAQAKAQWSDPAYKTYMLEQWRNFYASNEDYRNANVQRLYDAQVTYWADESNRHTQAERVKTFFETNPDARRAASEKAKMQWSDNELREWRSEKTKEQWTSEFRQKRMTTLNGTYYNKTLAVLKRIQIEQGFVSVDDYQAYRLQTRDKSLLRFDRFCERYFEGSIEAAIEAVTNYNHRITSVEYLDERIDVYDIEVPVTHNFALASGVFVHNSAKQGRDRHFQAILPLRGKILNTERARLDKMLDNNEIKALIAALGTGISEDMDVSKIRYDRIIIMSVAGDEPTLVKNHEGTAEFVRIGDFIDECLAGERNPHDYQVMSFDLNTHQTRFRPLKAVIRHSHEEPLYRITTRYNRSINVTSSHSVFVYEKGEVVLKKGSEIRPGDLLVSSRKLPRPESYPTHIDLLTTLYEAGLTSNLYVRGESVRQIAAQRVLAGVQRPDLWKEPRVELSPDCWKALSEKRQAEKLSLKKVADAVGVKQPITILQWERGEYRPILPQFEGYLDTIGWNQPLDYTVIPSKIDERLAQDDSSRNSRWRQVSNYKLLGELTGEELDQLSDEVQIVPRAHLDKGFGRYLPITRDLVWLLGWYVAEGTMSQHQVSINLGEKDERFIPEIIAAVENCFDETPRLYRDPNSKGIKLYFHSVAAARLLQAWGINKPAHEKKLPDVIFSLPEEMQIVFLEAYFLGDGTTAGPNISFTTNSPDLKDGLLYLLGQLGIIATHSQHQPATSADAPIQTRRDYYIITIAGKQQLETSRAIWQRHANAPLIDINISRPKRKSLSFTPISDDLMGLKVLSVEETEPVGAYVYDFSVQDDENFICGTGGICAHNTDADVDGSHIRTLLLTFFFRHMQPIITEGHLYIAQPPIFRLQHNKDVQYIYNQPGLTENDLLMRGLQGFKEPDRVKVSRYKGLGEMNPDQLWETTMDPSTRTLLQVTIDDAAEADRVFDMLMGSSVPPRRRFIQTHAKSVRNLDV